MLEPSTLFLTLAGVFVIAFMKGSFGGGFAIIGIPLLALVMDPLTAGGRSRMVAISLSGCGEGLG